MRIYEDISLADFRAWSGGRDTKEELKRLSRILGRDLLDELESLIEDIAEEAAWSDTQLNDFLWFDTDAIEDMLDITLYEDPDEYEDEDEDEYEDEDE